MNLCKLFYFLSPLSVYVKGLSKIFGDVADEKHLDTFLEVGPCHFQGPFVVREIKDSY
jgi:hypothetical protein